MKSRKTYEIKKIVEHANKMLKLKNQTQSERQGIIFILEEILHESGNYYGWIYLRKDDLPEGVLPGIDWEKYEACKSFSNWNDAPFSKNECYPDETRRKYF